MSLEHFRRPGKASFVLGGQWGSEGKGAACAFMATHLAKRNEVFDIVTANNGSQSGHTSTHDGGTKVLFHLPTASAYPLMFADGKRAKFQPLTYLNGGAIIDAEVLLQELEQIPWIADKLAIHPNAAIITPECKYLEGLDDSPQTKIASTRKGVGQALSRKILRSGMVAKDHVGLRRWVQRLDLNDAMARGASVLVEIPQGHSLSVDGPFYPHTTSRNCTVGQAMADAGIHPQFYHQSMLVVRTFPIRVGNIIKGPDTPGDGVDPYQIGHSGGHFPDQKEIGWEELGVRAEITTVTKRVRRVFTFSELQVADAIASTRPAVIYLTFCDYMPNMEMVKFMVFKLRETCNKVGSNRAGILGGPEILTQWGPTTKDVIRAEDL